MNEFYYELTVTPKNSLEVFSDFLLEITQNALEEKKGSLIVRSEEPLDDILWATEQFAEKLNIQTTTNLEKKKNEDWISKYKNSIQPIEVGSFYIRPEWEEAKENLTNIIINPALAFGSGHHETTYSCLQAIDKYATPNLRLLDVGCGSGILSIAANKKGAIVDICDTDEIATQNAIENFTLNNATINDSWIGSANKTRNEYDIVIANIIADVIIMIEKELKQRVKSGGILILSGIIDKYFNKVVEKFSDFDKTETIKKDEWYTLVLRKV
ncbi:MAG TPA: 50S ribosomal protein L11 methyltransferase [Campylobacterales bacterium]|nr:50S ribosomal protein L11 methyltransferase [Campylobacterales bacterium]